jgi:hypothetical protein
VNFYEFTSPAAISTRHRKLFKFKPRYMKYLFMNLGYKNQLIHSFWFAFEYIWCLWLKFILLDIIFDKFSKNDFLWGCLSLSMDFFIYGRNCCIFFYLICPHEA